MRLVSIASGIVVGLITASVVLWLMGRSNEPIHIFLIIPALLLGAVAGWVTSRRVERRENRLETQRRAEAAAGT
jgi:hypothetical protein